MIEHSPFASSLYDGRTRLGTVLDFGCKVSAQLTDGTVVGFFPNVREASNAIIAARGR